MIKSYKPTVIACYVSYITVAIVGNLTPLLFIPLREEFGFSFARLGALAFVNFGTQLLVDMLCAVFVDRLSLKRIAVLGELLIVTGLCLMSAVPVIPISPYAAIVLATFVFAVGAGMLEVVISPIVNDIPANDKSSAMSLLHSFYCWGVVLVALLSTLFLYAFGTDSWPALALLWALLPLINAVFLNLCPFAPRKEEAHTVGQTAGSKKGPLLALMMATIFFAGSAEITMAQWTSAYMEDAMELPKVVGDSFGVCLFAVMQGLGRTGYALLAARGRFRVNLQKIMMAGATLAAVCYVVVALSPIPALGVMACVLCGLGVSLLWPGTLSLAVEAFPSAGTWMFAAFAAFGDTGAAGGPWLAGIIADRSGLRTALLIAVIFPLGALSCLLLMKRFKKLSSISALP